MLEYFTYKKVKKHRQEKAARANSPAPQKPVLSPTDEQFLQRVVSEDEPPPPLPERPPVLVAGDPTDNDQQVGFPGEARGLPERVPSKKTNRFSFLQRSRARKDDVSKATGGKMNPDGTMNANEATKEKQDITSILDNLNLSAVNNTAFSLSKESQALVGKFTVVLKDLINGVPTAYDDLVRLLDDSSEFLQTHYSSLPHFLRKLIKTLPAKFSKNLGPEIFATAAGVAAEAEHSSGKPSMKSTAAKAGLRIPTLKEMVMKPGAVVGILKAIMNFLKLRWPAFIGTNVLWSLGLFVLLFVFWYCHKRGREVRLAKEKLDRDGGATVDSGRFEEIDSDSYDDMRDSFDRTDGEVERAELLDDASLARRQQLIAETKRPTRQHKWQAAPSNAPLESQESCVVI
ncbi:MAG: hypothetical protein M1838_002530 [Thelocarpon superellum]|nr:MAG: hypothetical protein M1838_002530 [Thelocarpon superellum]